MSKFKHNKEERIELARLRIGSYENEIKIANKRIEQILAKIEKTKQSLAEEEKILNQFSA